MKRGGRRLTPKQKIKFKVNFFMYTNADQKVRIKVLICAESERQTNSVSKGRPPGLRRYAYCKCIKPAFSLMASRGNRLYRSQ